MFTILLIIFSILATLTIATEHRRTKSLTLLSMASLANVLYMGVTPALHHYFPASTRAFEIYVVEAGLPVITEQGLIRVLLAASTFQLACLVVSVDIFSSKHLLRPSVITDKPLLQAATRVGWALVLLGVAGVILLGLNYNGSPLGLYQITYFERTGLARDNPAQAFMLLLGIFGAAQLIVVYLLTQKRGAAVIILIALTLHGLGMKSKFPVFWVLLVFLVVAFGQRGQIVRLGVPISVSALVLATMSALRGFEDYSSLPNYVVTYWDIVVEALASPWENDLPGPVSMLYYILNSDTVEHTIRPATEILLLLVPRFIYDRGQLLADSWAQTILGSSYETGMGFGWSPICDGYILAGWAGILIVSLVFASVARYITNLGVSGRHRDLFLIIGYSCAPFFFYGVRESIGGLIKQLLVIAVLVWVPTYYLSRMKKSKVLKLQQ